MLYPLSLSGICTSDGIVQDFGGHHYIGIDDMTFGKPLMYWNLSHGLPAAPRRCSHLWDSAVNDASHIFRQRQHNIFCNNCHHHVATALSLMRYQGRSNWNQVNVWWNVLLRGRYISYGAVAMVWGPFIVVLFLILAITLAGTV
eukprot:GHVS01045076.1.p1 GENE.GHVS01045076.1~~GHVS01045076.1.p1  ORF type:complete len:144 (+),score=7.49 GHVS01045076.1:252-683(+)